MWEIGKCGVIGCHMQEMQQLHCQAVGCQTPRMANYSLITKLLYFLHITTSNSTSPNQPSSLTFIGPCIVIYFYSKTNQMHQFLKFILFCSNPLYVLDGLSVHHQESKTVHAVSGICQTDSADCLLAGTRWNCSSISFPLASKTIWNMQSATIK
jgi:hypothetical protein